MINKLILPFLVLALSACSLMEKRQSGGGAVGSDSSYKDAPAYHGQEKASYEAPLDDEPPVAKVPPSASHYSALNDAVKSDSDEKIYQASTQILVQSPNDVRALNALAMYHYKKGRFDLARYLLAKGLGGQTQSSELYSNLGIVQLAQDERREAIMSFRKALSINQNDPVAASNLGAIYVAERDYAKALVVLETAYRRGVRDSRVLNNYGIALAANGNFGKAEDMYKESLKVASGNKEALFNYATLLVDHTKKYQQALDVLNRLKFVGGPADTRNRIIALENKAKAGLK